MQEIAEIRKKEEQALQEMGVSQEVIFLTGANVPETAEGPQNLLGKIIWYIDIMLTNTEAVPISQRIDQAIKGWGGKKYDPEKARRSITISDAYREKYQGKSLYDVQMELGKKIGAEFAEKIGYTGEVDLLPLFLQE